MKELVGTGVALITPFNKDLTVDVDGLKSVVNFNIENGIDYLVILGTTAESATLNKDEKQLVIDTVIKENNDRLPLVLGIGGNDTAAVIKEFQTRDLTAFTAILSVSNAYLDLASKINNTPFKKVIYWGVDLESFKNINVNNLGFENIWVKSNEVKTGMDYVLSYHPERALVQLRRAHPGNGYLIRTLKTN